MANAIEFTEKLIDIMATLKWEIWGSQDIIKRNTFPDDYSSNYFRMYEEQLFKDSYSIKEIIETSITQKG